MILKRTLAGTLFLAAGLALGAGLVAWHAMGSIQGWGGGFGDSKGGCKRKARSHHPWWCPLSCSPTFLAGAAFLGAACNRRGGMKRKVDNLQVEKDDTLISAIHIYKTPRVACLPSWLPWLPTSWVPAWWPCSPRVS